MFRSFFLFACLLGMLTTADAFAAPMGAAGFPGGKIMPGNHRPIYRLYGHHGLSSRGLFSIFRRKNTKLRSSHGKAHRGTL